MKRVLIIGLITLSCCRSVGEVKIHDKTKIYQEQKQMTNRQKTTFAISIFILVALMHNAI